MVDSIQRYDLALYKRYFKHLAKDDVDLCHEDSKGNRTLSYDIIDNREGIRRDGLRPKGFWMIVYDYVSDLKLNKSCNGFKHLHGGFEVLKWHESGDGDATVAAVEAVVDRLIGRMIYDSQNMPSDINFFNGSFSTKQDVSFVTVKSAHGGNYSGIFVKFSWMWPFNECPLEEAWKNTEGLSDESYLNENI